MKAMVWFIALAAVAGVVYGLYRVRAKWEERNKASEDRFASFMSQALPGGAVAPKAGAAPASVPSPALAPKPALVPKAGNDAAVLQRLLLEAASKAGEAGEPALSIQLYAKLLARYPQSPFADQARAAVEAQKKKLAPPKP